LVFLPTISFAFISALYAKQTSHSVRLFGKGPAMEQYAPGILFCIAASGVPKDLSPIRVTGLLFFPARRNPTPQKIRPSHDAVRRPCLILYLSFRRATTFSTGIGKWATDAFRSSLFCPVHIPGRKTYNSKQEQRRNKVHHSKHSFAAFTLWTLLSCRPHSCPLCGSVRQSPHQWPQRPSDRAGILYQRFQQ